MKKLFTTLAVAGSLTLAGAAAVAAPAGNPALDVQGLFTPAQYYGGGYGYGYRPYCYYVRRCSGYGYYQRCWRERICR